MKVQLVVVQGKPEGKIIPLTVRSFKIGRGENCQLRPNSEQGSREHAEFLVGADKVTVRDLGSRNGTIVNGKTLTGPCTLKDTDLIQVGPLTFAISIEGAPVAAVKAQAASGTAAKPRSPDDFSQDDIESWLVSDSNSPTPERPSGVYGGDTQTFSAYRGGSSKSTPSTPDQDEPESPPEQDDETSSDNETLSDQETVDEEMLDDSNPFNAAKKKPAATPAQGPKKDSCDVASDILRKMMERRRESR